MKISPIESCTFKLLRPSRSDEAADRKLLRFAGQLPAGSSLDQKNFDRVV